MTNPSSILVLLLATAVLGGTSHGYTLTETSNFTEIPQAVWGSDPGYRELRPFQIAGVTLAYQAARAPIVFSAAGNPDPDNPSSGFGIGFYKMPPSPYDGTPVIINFSTPISGFGATFLHNPDLFGGRSRMPVRIEAYSLPGAQGNLLGFVDDGGLMGWANYDFVGLFGPEPMIQSARLYGLAVDQFFAVSGYAVSLVPEPTSMLLFFLATGPFLWRSHFSLENGRLVVWRKRAPAWPLCSH